MTETVSDQTAESPVESPTIDRAELLNLAQQGDQEGVYGTDDSAQDADAARIVSMAKDVPAGDRAPAESERVAADKQHTAESSAEKDELDTGPPRDEKGRFKAREDNEPAEQPAEQKSRYAQAKDKDKETQRQERVLQGFQQRKEQWEAQAAQREAALAQREQAIAQWNQVPRQANGQPFEFNSQQYARAAEDFYGRGKQAEAAARKAVAEGDTDAANRALEEANKNFAMAERSSQAAEQVYAAEYQQSQQAAVNQHYAHWANNMEYACQQHPEWDNRRNPDSPIVKEIERLLRTEPLLEQLPNGFGVAGFIAEKTVQAAQASAVSERNKQLEAENKELRSRLGIRPAPYSGGPLPATNWDSMSDQNQANFLRQRAAEEDRIPAF